LTIPGLNRQRPNRGQIEIRRVRRPADFLELERGIILLIVLVLFGAKKLPELARGMGQAVKELQKAKDEFSDENRVLQSLSFDPNAGTEWGLKKPWVGGSNAIPPRRV